MPYSKTLFNTAIVILAAGESRRFQSCKQLAKDSKGISILERSIQNATSSLVGPVYVVLGARAAQIKRSITIEDVSFVENLQWKNGLGSSISCGVQAIVLQHPDIDSIIITLADQLELQPKDFENLARTQINNPDYPVASAYSATLGSPCSFPHSMFASLIKLEGKQGAKFLLRESNPTVIENPRAAVDIDTQAQWNEWLTTTSIDYAQ